MRAGLAPGQQGRGVRFHRYYLDIGILLLQIPASTGQSPTRPNSGYKNIHVSICVTPDLRPGGLVVGTGIGWIFKLAGDKAAGDRGGQLLGPASLGRQE